MKGTGMKPKTNTHTKHRDVPKQKGEVKPPINIRDETHNTPHGVRSVITSAQYTQHEIRNNKAQVLTNQQTWEQ